VLLIGLQSLNLGLDFCIRFALIVLVPPEVTNDPDASLAPVIDTSKNVSTVSNSIDDFSTEGTYLRRHFVSFIKQDLALPLLNYVSVCIVF